MRDALIVCSVLLVSTAGCGSDSGVPEVELAPTSGVVTQGETPLADADLTFLPVGATAGQGGSARTDAEGKFEVTSWTGEAGLPAGEYRVAVSRRLMPDGTPVPANDPTPPIESPATESLPAKYSSPEQTELRVTVGADGAPVEIVLE